MTRSLRSVLAAGVIALTAATPALGDTIAYVKDGDIWLTDPRVSRTVQVTSTGGYTKVSQADDGTLMGLYGRRLHRISPGGTILADFLTPVSGTAPTAGDTFEGPYDPAISPDGTKVAYTYYWTHHDASDPNCRPPMCIGRRTEAGTAYSHADRLTPWDEPGMGRQSGWMDPSWIDNRRTLLSDKAVRFGNLDVITDTVGDGLNDYVPWFDDTHSWYMRDGEMNLRAGVMAFVGTTPEYQRFQDDQIRIYRVNGDVPALPEHCYSYASDGPVYVGPSISPDGRHVVFTDLGKGIMIGDLPDLRGGCSLPTAGARLLIADAVSPDWGPAPLPAPGAGGPGPGTGGPGPGSAPAPKPGATPGAKPRPRMVLRTPAALRLARVRAAGVTARVTHPAAGRVSVVVTHNGRRVGAAARRVTRAGATTLRVRLGAPALRRLVRSRGPQPRLRVVATFTPAKAGARLSQARVITVAGAR